MKVIDLLNKIANEEEVPHKIKYNGYTYKKCVGNKTYWTGDKPSNTLRIDTYDLNEEVEIIEEDKEIKKWNYDEDCTNEWNFGEIKEKLDELVDAVNELKKGK